MSSLLCLTASRPHCLTASLPHCLSSCHGKTNKITAPVQDLRHCLRKGSLGSLNPFPWVMMTGNCLGWTVYGYYTRDPFVVAANIPGLVLSLWLNTGAAKLQYYQRMNEHRMTRDNRWDADPIAASAAAPSSSSHAARHSRQHPEEEEEDAGSLDGQDHNARLLGTWTIPPEEFLVMVPQERSLLRVLVVWVAVIVYVGWFSDNNNPASLVGLVVNVNLIFFYGAPLQTVRTVIVERNSNSIHVPTMVMNWMNTTFWIAYGLARRDPVIVLPNSVGLTLGLLQGLLRAAYPSASSGSSSAANPHHSLVLRNENENDNDGSGRCAVAPEDDIPPQSNIPREVL